MRILNVTAIALMLSTTASVAADKVVAEPALQDNAFEQRWSWTGFTAGIEAGYSKHQDTINNPGFCIFNPPNCGADGDGDVYGGFVGYNHQLGNFVVGVEGSYNHHGVEFDDGSGVVVSDVWALKGRLGYAFGRVQLYGTLGTAYASTLAPVPQLQDSDWGIIYGAGIDIGITENIFAGLQYSHQSIQNFANIDLGGVKPDIDAVSDVLTVRLGYKF